MSDGGERTERADGANRPTQSDGSERERPTGSAPRDRVGPGGEANKETLERNPHLDTRSPGGDAATPAREDLTASPLAVGELTGAPAETVATKTGMFGAAGPGDTSGYGGLVRRIQLPHSSEPPYGGWFDDVVRELATGLTAAGHGFGAAVESVLADRGELTLFVRREALLDVARRLRDDPGLRFEFCSGVSGVHFPEDTARELHAVYHLLSITHNRRIRLVVTCPDADPHIPSVVSVYPTNDWHERETWDFFGIVFDGHPALTRIQMPDDWPGHPQRKDYPLGGIPVEYKGATIAPPDERRSYT